MSDLEFDLEATLNTCRGYSQFPSVHRPAHYVAGTIECLDAIESALGHDGFVAFLRGQVIKYNWRLGRKGPPAEDAGKAAFYANRLAKTLEEK